MGRSLCAAGAVATVLALAALVAASCSREAPASRNERSERAASAASEAPRDARSEASPRRARVVFEPEDDEPAEVAVEIAKTPSAIERGLMYREHLPPDHGMLFIFPGEAIRSFWMKNTLIPLDMIFISSDREVVGIVENAAPQTTTRRGVSEASKYVVEVNGGWARTRGVERGTPVRFVNVETGEPR